MPDRPSVNRLSPPSEQASCFWGEITVPGIEEDRFDGQSGPSPNAEPGVSQRLTDHRGRLHPGGIETWATRSNATSWIYGRPSTKSRQPPSEHARSSDRYMLPVGATLPPDATTIERQILHALNALQQATERQVLELIARDRWHLAHKAFRQMVVSGTILSARPPGRRSAAKARERQLPVQSLTAIILLVRAVSPVSVTAKVALGGSDRPVRMVAFGGIAHQLLTLSPGRAANLDVRWLRETGRRNAKILAIHTPS